MALVLWALLLALAEPLTNAALGFEMEPRLWQHELKKTYCELIQRQRIYKVEQLDTYCAGKVAFFEEDMVSRLRRFKSQTFCPSHDLFLKKNSFAFCPSYDVFLKRNSLAFWPWNKL